MWPAGCGLGTTALESLAHGSLPVILRYRHATERLVKTLRDKMKKHETYKKSFSFKVHTYFGNRFVIAVSAIYNIIYNNDFDLPEYQYDSM